MDQTLRVEVELSIGTVVLRVLGEIDLTNCDHLRDAIDTNRALTTIVDLSGTDFMDSSGLAALIIARQSVDEIGGSLVLRRPSSSIRLLLERSGLDFLLSDDEPDAG